MALNNVMSHFTTLGIINSSDQTKINYVQVKEHILPNEKLDRNY